MYHSGCVAQRHKLYYIQEKKLNLLYDTNYFKMIKVYILCYFAKKKLSFTGNKNCSPFTLLN